MRKKIIYTLWTLLILISLTLVAGIIAIDKGWIGYMPDMQDLENPIDKYASQLLSDDGQPLGTWSQSENRGFAPYDSISPVVYKALIATEDVRFYDHPGVDARALVRAIVKRGILRQKSAGGGSTITQQLAKQLYSETAHSTMERLLQKPIEWVIAVELERHYTKEEIMTLYLNHFDFLHNAVGIRTASQVYFNKKPWELDTNNAALLVGMCKNPAYYNPVRHPERCMERRNVVFEQMLKAGYLAGDEFAQLSADSLKLNFHRLDYKTGPTPYLREYLRRIMMADKPDPKNYASWQRQKYYEDSLGWADDPLYGWCKKNTKHNGKNYDLYTDGLKVYTTINARMQQYAEEAVRQHVGGYLQAIFNSQRRLTPNFPYVGVSKKTINNILQRNIQQSQRYRAMKEEGASIEEIQKAFHTKTEMTVFTYRGEKDTTMTPIDSILYYKTFLRSSLVSIDPTTGHVKAYVGGIDYKHFQYDMGLVGRRQVGSTMKPFVYSLAMEDGLTPDYKVRNIMRNYGGWTPKNGSRAAYGAMMPLSWGLAQSNNWITAGIMNQVDPTGKRLEQMLRSLGVANHDVKPSMVLCLGPCEITACELASAYTMFANRGLRSAPILVSRIEDAQGNVIAEFQPRQNEVISEFSASEMLEMLQGVANRGTARRLHGMVKGIGPVAAKTGTTNNNADAWFVGMVPRLVTACWVGGEDRDIHFMSTSIGQGAAAALPIWAKYIGKVYADPTLGYSSKDEFPQFDPNAQGGNEVMNDYADAPVRPRRTTPKQDELLAGMGNEEEDETSSDNEENEELPSGNNALPAKPKEQSSGSGSGEDLFN